MEPMSLEKLTAVMTFQPRMENAGDEKKGASTLHFISTVPNTILDLFDPALRAAFYRKELNGEAVAMPWYRVHGAVVHLNLGGKARRNPPPQCRAPDPTARDGVCRGIGSLLCDAPVNEAGDTCDMPLCVACATEIGPDRHLCPKHRDQAELLPAPKGE